MLSKSQNKITSLDKSHLEKVVLAQKVGKAFSEEPDSAEAIVVGGIAKGLAEDVSKLVRQTLAFEVRRSPFLPKDIAITIAKDIEEVAGPFLEATEVFTDKELAALVPIVEDFAKIALSKREKITTPLTESLINHGTEKSLAYLVRNKGAEFDKNSCEILLKNHSDSIQVLNQFSMREKLPLEIIEELSQKVSKEYREILVKNYKISGDHASFITKESAEVAFGDVLLNASPQKIQVMVNDLSVSGRLNPETILNYTRRGSLDFFVAAMAKKVKIPFGNVKKLVEEGGYSVLIKLLEKAEIPESYYKGFRDAVRTALTKNKEK